MPKPKYGRRGGGTSEGVFPKEGDWRTLAIPKGNLGDLDKIKSIRVDFAEPQGFINSLDRDKAFPISYKPESTNRCGDPMPFWDAKDNTYKVLFLYEQQHNPQFYHPIYGVSTKDAFNYKELGMVLNVGGRTDVQDAVLGTGCCFWDGSKYHLFYTGENGDDSWKNSHPMQAVMHKTSTDLKTWQTQNFKVRNVNDARPVLENWMDNGGYSSSDFRDPDVFKADDGKWHMVVATKKDDKGVLAEYISADLVNWEHKGIFLNSNMQYNFYECPNVFKLGNYWYLVYSEVNWDVRKVRYIKAEASGDDGLEGLRQANAIGTDLNGRGYYAGKTAGKPIADQAANDDEDRIMWGWSPFYDTSKGEKTEWGGALVASRIKQNDDGTLVLVEPSSYPKKYNAEVPVEANTDETDIVKYPRLGYHNRITCTVTAPNTTDKFGFTFATDDVNIDETQNKGITLNIEKVDGKNDKCVVKYIKEGVTYESEYESYEFDRPSDGVFNISIVTDNSVLSMYINEKCAYTCRIDHLSRNVWKFRKYEGNQAAISNVKVYEYEDNSYDQEYTINVRSNWNDSGILALNGSPLINKHGNYALINVAGSDLTKNFATDTHLRIQVHPEWLDQMTATKVSTYSSELLYDGSFKCDWTWQAENTTLRIPAIKFGNLRVGQRIVVEYEMDSQLSVDEVELHDGYVMLPGTTYKNYLHHPAAGESKTQSLYAYVTHGMYAHLVNVGFEVTGHAITVKKVWIEDRPETDNIKASAIWSGYIWSDSHKDSYDFSVQEITNPTYTKSDYPTIDFACNSLETEMGGNSASRSYRNLDNYKAMRFYYESNADVDFDLLTGFNSGEEATGTLTYGTYQKTNNDGTKTSYKYAELPLNDASRTLLNEASTRIDRQNQFFVRINKANEVANFNLTDVTLVPGSMKIKAGSVATFSSMENVQVSGAKAYTMVVENDKLVCTLIEDGKVPAGQGVLLFNETDAEATATFTTINKDKTIEFTDAANRNNQLIGTSRADHNLEAVDIPAMREGKIYCLYGGTKLFGPFQSTSFQSNRAFIRVDGNTGGSVNPAKTMSIIFTDPTGIVNVSNESKKPIDNTIYNLAGQRINQNYRGVVIKNNKKYFVK